MNGMRKGLILAAVQIAIVLSLGGKLLYDRATRPRAWVLCQVYDPELPIRGRYLAENLQMPAQGFTYTESKPNRWYMNPQWAYLEVHDERLTVSAEGSGNGMWVNLRRNADGTETAISQQPVLIFIPDSLADTLRLKPGDQMWVEVTLPKQGPPRPIRLAILGTDGKFTPITTG